MYLFVALSIVEASLPEALKTPSIDVVHVVCDSFGIDDARALSEQSLLRPVSSPVRVFVVFATSLTVQAQNALLKLFEDPPTTAAFYIVVPHESVFIGTLRSRLLKMDAASSEQSVEDAQAFRAMSVAERIAHIAALQKKGDADGLVLLARQLARIAATDTKLPQEVREEIAFVESKVGLKGGSKKMLLEHLALILRPY